jgi:hypothetical protein
MPLSMAINTLFAYLKTKPDELNSLPLLNFAERMFKLSLTWITVVVAAWIIYLLYRTN